MFVVISTHTRSRHLCAISRNAKYKWNVPLKCIYWSIFFLYFSSISHSWHTFPDISHTQKWLKRKKSPKIFRSHFHSNHPHFSFIRPLMNATYKPRKTPVYLDEDGNVMSACPRRASTSHTAKPTKIVPIPPVNSCFVFNQTNRWQIMQLQCLVFIYIYSYINHNDCLKNH